MFSVLACFSVNLGVILNKFFCIINFAYVMYAGDVYNIVYGNKKIKAVFNFFYSVSYTI